MLDFGERSMDKNYRPVSLLSMISKVFENLAIGLLITWRNVAFCVNSRMVSGLPDQLQIL